MSPRTHWLLRPRSIRLLWVGGIVLLAVFVALGAAIHPHATFGIEGSFGFNAWYGFATCAAMVVGAKVLGWVLKRKDDYYEH